MTNHLHQFCNLSCEQASEVLATVTAINRRARAKQAAWTDELGKYVGQAKDYAGQLGQQAGDTLRSIGQAGTPEMEATRNALIGAGIGAGAGGLMSLTQPKEKRRSLRSMTQGAVLGGLAGGGGTLAAQNLPGVWGTLNGQTPTDLPKTVADAELDLRQMRAQGYKPEALQEQQQTVDALKQQLASAAPPAADAADATAPATPPVKAPGMLERIPVAAESLAAGEPGNAIGAFAPNKTNAEYGAVGGLAAGTAAGFGVGHLLDKGNISRVGGDAAASALQGAVSGPELAEIQKALPTYGHVIPPRGMTPGRRLISKNKQPLLQKAPASPWAKGFRYLLPMAGALTGAAYGGGQGTPDAAQ